MEKKTVRIIISDEAREVLTVAGVAVAGILGMIGAYHVGSRVAMIKVDAGLHKLERVEPGFVTHTIELLKKYDQLYRK